MDWYILIVVCMFVIDHIDFFLQLPHVKNFAKFFRMIFIYALLPEYMHATCNGQKTKQ